MGNLSGFKKNEGQWEIPPGFKSVKTCPEGTCIVECTDGSGFAFLNEIGQRLLKENFLMRCRLKTVLPTLPMPQKEMA